MKAFFFLVFLCKRSQIFHYNNNWLYIFFNFFFDGGGFKSENRLDFVSHFEILSNYTQLIIIFTHLFVVIFLSHFQPLCPPAFFQVSVDLGNSQGISNWTLKVTLIDWRRPKSTMVETLWITTKMRTAVQI